MDWPGLCFCRFWQVWPCRYCPTPWKFLIPQFPFNPIRHWPAVQIPARVPIIPARVPIILDQVPIIPGRILDQVPIIPGRIQGQGQIIRAQVRPTQGPIQDPIQDHPIQDQIPGLEMMTTKEVKTNMKTTIQVRETAAITILHPSSISRTSCCP